MGRSHVHGGLLVNVDDAVVVQRDVPGRKSCAGPGHAFFTASKIYGAPGRIRTCDLRIRSPELYPAELRARIKNMG